MENLALSKRLVACFDMRTLVSAKQGSVRESSVSFSIMLTSKRKTFRTRKFFVIQSMKMKNPMKMTKSKKITNRMKLTQSMNLNVTCATRYTLVKIHLKNVVTIKTVHLKNVV